LLDLPHTRTTLALASVRPCFKVKIAKCLKKKGYKTGKGTMQIKFDQKVPTTTIKKIPKAKMNEAKSAIK